MATLPKRSEKETWLSQIYLVQETNADGEIFTKTVGLKHLSELTNQLPYSNLTYNTSTAACTQLLYAGKNY